MSHRVSSIDHNQRPRSPSSPHRPSIALPTPALLGSVAGGAHYSGIKIDSDTRKIRHNSSGHPSDHHEIKGNHQKVIEDLNELYCCRPTREIFERRWRPDARFEDPLCKCVGYRQYAAQWFALPSLFSKSETVSTRIMSSTKSPNRLVYEQTQEYTLRLFAKKKSIHSIIVVDLDEEEKIVRLVDHWDGKEMPMRYGAQGLRVLNAKVVPWFVKFPKRLV